MLMMLQVLQPCSSAGFIVSEEQNQRRGVGCAGSSRKKSLWSCAELFLQSRHRMDSTSWFLHSAFFFFYYLRVQGLTCLLPPFGGSPGLLHLRVAPGRQKWYLPGHLWLTSV